MINRETRKALKILFKEREQLQKDIPWNTAEAKSLRERVKSEYKESIHNKMWAEINWAEPKIAKQKERLALLTNPKIAKAADLTYDVVVHQHKLFNKCEYVL